MSTDTLTHSPITIERTGSVAVVVIDNRPINVGNHDVRAGLLAAISEIEADPTISAGVLIGGKSSFIVGSDLKEFDRPLAEPQLPAIIAAIEASRKPFVAAIHGAALGGGFELALGCDARIAAPASKLGLPETTLGMVPGAGGTQRLPHLIGTSAAIEIITSGRHISAEEGLRLGMIDLIAHGDLKAQSIDFAYHLGTRKSPALGRKLPPENVEVGEAAATRALEKGRNLPHIVEAVRLVRAAGRVPAVKGLLDERASFQRLRTAPHAKALRHMFFAERRAAKSDFAATGTPREIACVGVVGAGTMGAGIALALVQAGVPTIMVDNTQSALDRGMGSIDRSITRRTRSGRIDAAHANKMRGQLETSLDLNRMAVCDLVIEAVIEDIEVKREVFSALDRIAKPDALLASNTSYLDIDALAKTTSRPESVLGLHFFSPAHATRLLEVVRAEKTGPDAVASGLALARKLGKQSVVARNVFGFIGNRIYAAYRRECEFMLEDGALPHEVDAALEAFGFAIGPFAVADLSGLDIAWRMRQAQTKSRHPEARYVTIPDRLCEAGRMGRKTGFGYYAYSSDEAPGMPDPAVEAIIVEAAQAAGRKRYPIMPETIVRRALVAMVNEAALALADRVTGTPASIDSTMVNGYGFPRWIGGPLHWARQQEPRALAQDCDTLVAAAGKGGRRGDLTRLGLDLP